MDEADILADRVGILIKGNLACLGSPLFLKTRFDVGYRVTFVKTRGMEHLKLESLLNSHFLRVRKTSEVYDEVSYLIPGSEARNLADFFATLDARLDELYIRSYAVAMCSLEDVFLKLRSANIPDLFGNLRYFMNDEESGRLIDGR